MKLKIEIDISDLVVETEEYSTLNLKEELLYSIKQTIKGDVLNQLRESVKRAADKVIEESIHSELPKIIEDNFKFISNETVIQSKGTIRQINGERVEKENITLQELILSSLYTRFQSTDVLRALETYLVKMADNSVNQIKQQYDLFFATQIVQKMGEQNLLKDGIAKSLIEGQNHGG